MTHHDACMQIEEKFVRGSGAGGQKINKTSSCVQMAHIRKSSVTHTSPTASKFDIGPLHVGRFLLQDLSTHGLRNFKLLLVLVIPDVY
jgi:hypothetical protein